MMPHATATAAMTVAMFRAQGFLALDGRRCIGMPVAHIGDVPLHVSHEGSRLMGG